MKAFLFRLALLPFLLCLPAMAGATQDYLYQRDISVPAYQTLREFFDMPNRPGNYEVTLLSDAIGPLTFRVIRVRGEHESTLGSKRSYRVGAHDFQHRFDNTKGEDDLMVEISNSNPAAKARVTVYVVELP
ncbi:MAG: hypothetical protein COW19_04480 [Zetaproteobacteria bacterium CG12_big_fil_rev_8_21_14_0_65_55_1124]|nr:MAG: hypothetical protein AUJ58_07025 [Zetaproteobacteria bacterium CG1_02_55_237]PIS20275.1 MAG: hypothetical protein COT53_01430 [Zetaproteobacteria bacterium CG08_land_8_20_14_0_20_55_17]PIW43152.1 MAG: hypothetical protein COW19_04480 [Zetaproteobacteria bacterium CG12_big_fil_rev_8_21_14_0_65_55_1124]PIY52116.1 MAG: hypothetical protein COZ01_08930 [Zetaproteobacteria bacterium CG_4_10_14_0_8_um_filter_55_43]PIZ38128.1 MAG: hypothetical protein COY36_07130 [Zetaproteobacteria bacterium 